MNRYRMYKQFAHKKYAATNPGKQKSQRGVWIFQGPFVNQLLNMTTDTRATIDTIYTLYGNCVHAAA
jgi:hypothetical protein